MIFIGKKQNWMRIQYWFGKEELKVRKAINQKHPFFISLNKKEQEQFLWRLYYFLNTTEFVIKFQSNHQKIQTTISFVAAQISYALPIESFDLYHKVIVYEDDYYSQINQRYHKGEVNPGLGIMVFSWNAIQFGLSKSNDGLNLLLHEFAHALRLEHKLMSYNIFNEQYFDDLDKILQGEFENMLDSGSTIFRAYATTNIEEFFAVASEVFFERSKELESHLPILHNAFVKLYNQHPQT
jgi:Mlc titration factor MtfA (ptsG expression regulator)